MKPWAQKQKGFTLVELIIVIAVVSILAAITIVGYSGVQQKARDAARTESIMQIQKALDFYNAKYGRFPQATANPGLGGWEMSTDAEGSFMEYLVDAGLMTRVPLDPKNNSSHHFRYHRYGPGTYGCPVERGGFYVLRVQNYENAKNKPTNGQGVSCPTGSQTVGPTSPTYIHAAFEKD